MIKNKNILIGILVLVIIIILLFLNMYKQKDDSKEITDYQKIKIKLENKEEFFIYITDKQSNCYSCINADKIISYYEDTYNINFIKFKINNNLKKDYEDLKKNLNIDDNGLMTPSVIYIKDGIVYRTINYILVEDQLRNFLLDSNKIDSKYKNIDVTLTGDTFKEIRNMETNTLILLFNQSDESYKLRREMFKIAYEYDIKYYILFNGISNTYNMYNELKELESDEINYPALLILNNNKLIDYVETSSGNKIEKFLIKNNIIK